MQQPLVKALIVVSEKGSRICARFCDREEWPNLKSQRDFEKSLLTKVKNLDEASENVEIMEFREFIIAYCQIEDVYMFAVGGKHENELVIAEVLSAFQETLKALLRNLVDQETVLENLQAVILVIDELVDQEGVIMEWEPIELASRAGQQTNSFMDQVPLGEQTLSQALQTAKDQITRSILS